MAAERLFIINEQNIEQILLADNSDDENNLLLDDEDVNFLEEDVDKTGEEVIIELPVPVQLLHRSSPLLLCLLLILVNLF